MTTNAIPPRTPRVLVAAATWVLASAFVVAAIAAPAGGAVALRSALLGSLIVLVFFAFGAGFVGIAARLAPTTALMIAMLTYTLQVAVVALVFVGLTRADAFAEDLDARWLAGALIAGTFAWMAGQLISTLRAPIEPWTGPVLPFDDEDPDVVRAQEVGAA